MGGAGTRQSALRSRTEPDTQPTSGCRTACLGSVAEREAPAARKPTRARATSPGGAASLRPPALPREGPSQSPPPPPAHGAHRPSAIHSAGNPGYSAITASRTAQGRGRGGGVRRGAWGGACAVTQICARAGRPPGGEGGGTGVSRGQRGLRGGLPSPPGRRGSGPLRGCARRPWSRGSR